MSFLWCHLFFEAGLVKNIGDGVQDFFYEPYLGLQQSPTNFVIGVGKGTGSKATVEHL